MVDVTFPFIILLGGPLAGVDHGPGARAHAVGAKRSISSPAAICGPLATTLWMSVAGRLFARGPDEPYMSPRVGLTCSPTCSRFSP